MERIEVIAHRGYTKHFPENTIIGIGAAIEAGARAVEIDIQFTSDQVPVLFHDDDMKRVCGVNGAIHDYSLEQLQGIPVSEPERFGDNFKHTRIATLQEYVDLIRQYPEVLPFIEIKRIAIERFGIDAVLSMLHSALAPIRQRCVLISFDYEFLLAARRKDWTHIGVVLKHWKDRRLQVVKDTQPDYLFCNYRKLPWLLPVGKGNAKLALYEIDDPLLARKLARRGADYIETFSVGEMLKALGQSGGQV